jgi:hypothetical protein
MKTREMNNIEYLLEHMPETNRLGLYHLDPAVHAFVCLMQKQNDIVGVLNVVDEVFVHYTKVINQQQEQIITLLREATPETMRRMQDSITAKSAENNL